MRLTDDPVTQHLRAHRRRDRRRVIGTLLFSLLSAPLVGIAQIELEQWLAAGPSVGQSHAPEVEEAMPADPFGWAQRPIPSAVFSPCGCVSAWQGKAHISSQGDRMIPTMIHFAERCASRLCRHWPAEVGAYD